jgi:hypothetical protein
VKKWFGQRERVFLWTMEGMSDLVWVAFAEFTFVAFQIFV